LEVEQVAEQLGQGKQRKSGSGWTMPCPAHEDSTPSLSVSEGRNGNVVVYCHAGCQTPDVLAAGGLELSDLQPLAPREKESNDDWTPAGTAIARYRYVDENGRLLFEVMKTKDKRFFQRRPDSTARSGWIWKLGDVRKPLYRLPEVINGIREGQPIFICEGEKDVESLRKIGCIATCNPGGAGKWSNEYTETLKEAEVIIIADKDDIGYRHARNIASELEGVARRVIVAEAKDGKDVTDHLNAGWTVDNLVVLTAENDQVLLVPDIYQFLEGTDEYDWIVDGLLERMDRLMVTGFEGWGKSTFIQQFAISVAGGLHPVTHKKIKPVRVLLIDCENGERHVRRRFRPLVDTANRYGHIEKDTFFPIIRPEGLDLTTADDRNWLLERGVALKPDIVFIGPLYNLHRANPNEELPARLVASTLNDLRTQAKCALVIEAHATKGDTPKDRYVRPLGSSLWLRWPEFGYGLAPIAGETDPDTHTPVEFKEWRGDRDERQWPKRLERSTPWPWQGTLLKNNNLTY